MRISVFPGVGFPFREPLEVCCGSGAARPRGSSKRKRRGDERKEHLTAMKSEVAMRSSVFLMAALLCGTTLFGQENVKPARQPAKQSAKVVKKVPAPQEEKEEALDYGSPKVKQKLIGDSMFRIGSLSVDPEYGYSIKKPIMVGGGKDGMEGPKNEQRFLNALAGPNGEKVTYRRRGSGYSFKTKNGIAGGDTGLLDIYEVSYPGIEKPVTLYLNMYDSDTLKVPTGFTKRSVEKADTKKPKKGK